MKTAVVPACGLFTFLSALIAVTPVAFARQSDPLDTDLVIRYQFNGNFSDSSGAGRHPTQVDVSLIADRFGNPSSACYFNGTSSYLTVGQVPEPTDNNFTWAVWLRADSLSTSREYFELIARCYEIGNNYLSPHLFLRPSGAVSFGSCCYSEPIGVADTSAGRIIPGDWIHVAVTGSRISEGLTGTRTIFINGEIAGSDTVPDYGQTNMLRLVVGADRFLQSGMFFKGAMDDLRIYSRQLSQIEIRRLYSGPDCNGDGIGDWNQIADGTLHDDNHNRIPDVCEYTVTGVIPVSGASSGGTSVLINGTNFPENPMVLIGGVPATDVARVSATRITATTPAGLPGMTTVTVGNWVQPNAFYYRPECGSDLDQDGEVTAADISIVLLDFGPCYQTPLAAPEPEVPPMLEAQPLNDAPRQR